MYIPNGCRQAPATPRPPATPQAALNAAAAPKAAPNAAGQICRSVGASEGQHGEIIHRYDSNIHRYDCYIHIQLLYSCNILLISIFRSCKWMFIEKTSIDGDIMVIYSES